MLGMSENHFPFIVSDGPKVPKDPAIRTLIRKQAMKDIGLARKRRGDYGRVNMRQFPVFGSTEDQNQATVPGAAPAAFDLPVLRNDSSSSDSSSDNSTPEPFPLVCQRRPCKLHTWEEDAIISRGISAPARSYEAMRIMYRVDLTDLSVLTGFNIGHSTKAALAEIPARLASLMASGHWSYLEYVPQLYGVSDCVTAATDCVAAKARSVLAPTTSPRCQARTLLLYSKALQALQSALMDTQQSLSADVLCATELMSLHELLNSDRKDAWSRHVAGSARLVEYQASAKNFDTDIEQSLFIAHCGPVVSEALMKDQYCYLAEPKWQNMYVAMARDDPYLTDRSELVLRCRRQMLVLPSLWHDIGLAMRQHSPSTPAAWNELVERTRKAHAGFLASMDDYKDHCVSTSLKAQPQEEHDKRREVFGTTVECLIVVKRLLATLYDKDRIELEAEVQALARLILDLQNEESGPHSWIFAMHEVGVANSVITTNDDWCGPNDDTEDAFAASSRRFLRWDSIIRPRN